MIARTAAGVIAALLLASPALAGPPYLSDDPQPTDLGHWEIYNYALGQGGPDGLAGEAGLDINYGAAKDVQLTAVLPLAYESDRGFSAKDLRAGPADIELAIKWKFLHQDDKSWLPDVAVFPRVFVPTSPAYLGGTGRASLFLPIWAEKDYGPWAVFGGGGYQINPGPDQRDFWQGGLAVSHSFGDRLSLGGEVYGQTRDAVDGGGYWALDGDVTYKLVEHWSAIASLGPVWSQSSSPNGYVFYLALKADY